MDSGGRVEARPKDRSVSPPDAVDNEFVVLDGPSKVCPLCDAVTDTHVH